MLFDQYDRVRIISLESRQDRRRFAVRQILKTAPQLGTKAQFFNAIVPDQPGPFISRGAYGCFLSHLAVLREAANEGQSVLIIEDDCVFRPEITSYEPYSCDMLVGGWLTMSDPDCPRNSDVTGTHLMGFNTETAVKIAAYFEAMLQGKVAPDPKGSQAADFNPNILPPVDGAYAWYRRAHPELKVIFADLAYQRASRSDITPGGMLDRIPVIRDFVEAARRFKRTAAL